MSGSEDSGGGFARGFIYGALLAGVGFAAFAVLNPLKGDMEMAPVEETQSQVVEPAPDATQDTAEVTTPAEPVPAENVAEVAAPTGPELGAPAIDEDSGLSVGSDAAPAPATPDTQVAIATPVDPDTPAVGSDAPEAPEVTDDLTADAPDEPVESALTAGNALSDNSVAVVGADNRPYFAIILEDVGDQGFPRESLTGLTAAISIGVPVTDPEATAIAELYKEAGFEIVAVLPSDLETTTTVTKLDADLAAYFQTLPSAASVLSPQTSRLANDTELSQALLAALSRTGHGVLSYPGEGTVLPRLASSAGVPGVQIFRVIDERPEPENVTLALERALTEAKERGAVIVTGHTRPDTITTLFAWLLGPGSSSVKVVPVSAAIGRLNE